MKPTPIIILGDAPNIEGGLARIARDVTRLIWESNMDRVNLEHEEELALDPAQLGWGYDGEPFPWRVFPVLDGPKWAEGDILQTLDWHAEFRAPAVVLTIWDPSRCWHVAKRLEEVRRRGLVKLWGYFPFDSENDEGKIGGPAKEALEGYDRILAYGKYGAKVICKTLGDRVVPWLPHGISDDWRPMSREEALEVLRETGAVENIDPEKPLLGCVATNQPRKDLGLFFRTAQVLNKAYGGDLRIWLHTDQLVVEGRDNTWAIPELVEIYGFNSPQNIWTQRLDDRHLCALYSLCWATIAPGLGEGFGYPIAESLASGTPVIHGDFAGGAELVPEKRWLIPPAVTRLDGPYALQRPVFRAETFAERAIEAMEWKRRERGACAAYCSGAVEHLRWKHLRARWTDLLGGWLRELREPQETKEGQVQR